MAPLNTAQAVSCAPSETVSWPVRPSAEDDLARDVWCLLGLPFDRCDMEGAKRAIRKAVAERRQLVLTTPNVNFVVNAQRDPGFRDTVIHSDMSIIDGQPLVWAAQLLGIPLQERVPGSGLMEALLNESGDPPMTVFFFGGEEGAGERACEQVNARNGGLKAVGHCFPGFGSVQEMSTREIIARINAADPDLLLASLGSKKGLAWIEHNRHKLNARVITHVGAVINFLAGTVRRAPPTVQRVGLEWLWRIYEEPSLWRRYFDDGCDLAALVATRLVPHYLRLRHQRSPTGSLNTDVSNTEDGIRLTFGGIANQQTLRDVKPRLTSLFSTDQRVTVALDALEDADGAFLGLLLLLRKRAWDCGATLAITGASPRLRRLFHQNNALYLLDS